MSRFSRPRARHDRRGAGRRRGDHRSPPTAAATGTAASSPAATPDPETASQVRWIFTQRLAGYSVAGIARTLNALGVAPPSAHDRARNPHPCSTAWTLWTVASSRPHPRRHRHLHRPARQPPSSPPRGSREDQRRPSSFTDNLTSQRLASTNSSERSGSWKPVSSSLDVPC
ncbi:recombinase family protein [Couchioplanes caeruleus]|uniref:recombinase family protein n=1 Tax=Couchioplanes caeruleus TaxID=56438 RepID=UPI000A065881